MPDQTPLPFLCIFILCRVSYLRTTGCFNVSTLTAPRFKHNFAPHAVCGVGWMSPGIRLEVGWIEVGMHSAIPKLQVPRWRTATKVQRCSSSIPLRPSLRSARLFESSIIRRPLYSCSAVGLYYCDCLPLLSTDPPFQASIPATRHKATANPSSDGNVRS